jgi:hypothetical protein
LPSASDRFESETLPTAEAEGWSKLINWEDFAPRVQAMKLHLLKILDDRGDPIVYATDDDKDKRQRDESDTERTGVMSSRIN